MNAKETDDVSDLLLTPFEAVQELERRRKDPTLKKKVEEYLKGDIPSYFNDEPILCLSRYIATPNFETLRFMHLLRHSDHKLVITYDSKSLFVTQNKVKRALCKLPICRRVTQRNGKINEQFQNMTIVDFKTADGEIFSDIQTLWGEPLIDFHVRLFREISVPMIEVHDDADWIDRHHRDNLLEHYKKLLALFVVHGVFFENYNIADVAEIPLVRDIIQPASRFIEEKFGCRPLISELFPITSESYQFWISYPGGIYDVVRESKQRLPAS